jgi:hypothetical protein
MATIRSIGGHELEVRPQQSRRSVMMTSPSDRSTRSGCSPITAENRAAIAWTQITCWLAINASELNHGKRRVSNRDGRAVPRRNATITKIEITEPVFKKLSSLLSREQVWRCIAAERRIPRQP